jgi:hypothetical protein
VIEAGCVCHGYPELTCFLELARHASSIYAARQQRSAAISLSALTHQGPGSSLAAQRRPDISRAQRPAATLHLTIRGHEPRRRRQGGVVLISSYMARTVTVRRARRCVARRLWPPALLRSAVGASSTGSVVESKVTLSCH